MNRLDLLDAYYRAPGPLHAIPAGWKLAVVVALMVSVIVLPGYLGWQVYAGVALLLAGVVLWSRISWRHLLRRLLWLEPIVLIMSLLALFQPEGGRIFLALMLKSTLSLCLLILLSSTTSFSAIIQVLRKMGTPLLLVTTLSLMYRYLFVLVDESERMRRARASRTFVKRRAFDWRVLSDTIAVLFIRASERAERIYSAMCARGWNLENRK